MIVLFEMWKDPQVIGGTDQHLKSELVRMFGKMAKNMESGTDSKTVTLIGSDISHAPLSGELIVAPTQALTEAETNQLWELFTAIGRCWQNVVYDSKNLKSSWLEFIEAKTTVEPSYVGEYLNAIDVLKELFGKYSTRDEAYIDLFLRSGVPQNSPPVTRIAHAKIFVVDEFIKVQVVASGFKLFGAQEGETRVAKNYNGYVGGSRYNERPPYRAYVTGEDN